MARPRNPLRDRAKKLWLQSCGNRTCSGIAAELGIPASRVRKWKSEDAWEKERPPGKPGAPKGNTNAVGNRGGPGAEAGNKRALMTGEFESIFYDSLDDGEKEMLNHLVNDKKELLRHQINILMVRERKMMQKLSELRSGSPMLERRERWNKELINVGSAYLIKPNVGVSTLNEAADERILRIEEALTRIQAELRRCVDSLRQLDESELKYF